MIEIIRKAGAVWIGGLRRGKGTIRTESKVLDAVPYTFATRFEDRPGTNPEELLAAAHAACYAMAFTNTLVRSGYKPLSIDVRAACVLEKQDEGSAITRMKLLARCVVPEIESDTLFEVAKEADQGCPVSNLLRPGLTIELETELLG